MKKTILLIILCFLLCSCSKNELENKEPVKKVEYYCENGTLVENRCKIVEQVKAIVDCPDGFPFNEELKTCAKIVAIPAPGKYTCIEGYKLKGGKCISEISYDKIDGKCPADKKLYNGECKDIKYRVYEYYCPEGTLNKDKCEFPDEKKTEISCPEGYTINKKNVTCEKITMIDAQKKEVPN